MATDGFTHYLPYPVEPRQRFARAACGRTIWARDHAVNPTCPNCLVWLAAYEAEAARETAAWAAAEEAAKTLAAATGNAADALTLSTESYRKD